MIIVAVTSCPTGIAHTYMAAEQLERAAKKLGHTIKVETQGAMGIENELSQAEIDQADLIIFAADIPVQKRERFSGLQIRECSVQDAIRQAEKLLGGQ
jgi:fructose-specific phosphotransferase system IIB component